jgi:Kinesin motor domain
MEATIHPDSIAVAIRIRPLSESENAGGHGVAFERIPNYNQIGQFKDGQLVGGQTFDFDKVYDQDATTHQIYISSAKNLVANVMNGINGTIFACKCQIVTISYCRFAYLHTSTTTASWKLPLI